MGSAPFYAFKKQRSVCVCVGEGKKKYTKVKDDCAFERHTSFMIGTLLEMEKKKRDKQGNHRTKGGMVMLVWE